MIKIQTNEFKHDDRTLYLARRIVAEIEAERELVEANRKLIKIYEQKIQVKLAEILGSEGE